MKPRYALGCAAVLIGSSLNYFGDRLLGVRLEYFYGLMTTFGLASLADIFIVPFVAGIGVAWIFGHGAKWLGYFPPLIVRSIAYAHVQFEALPAGAHNLPFGWWGFFVILAMESAGIGGVLGEVFIKKIYTRTAAEKLADTLVDAGGADRES
jgi:hypothetical protein